MFKIVKTRDKVLSNRSQERLLSQFVYKHFSMVSNKCLKFIFELSFIKEFERQIQGSRWRAIRAKKSPCEGWLRFLVGQKRSSSRLVIFKSRPMSPPTYFLIWKCQYRARVYWNTSYPVLSILKVIFLESNPLRFIETLISFIRGFVYCLYMPGLK